MKNTLQIFFAVLLASAIVAIPFGMDAFGQPVTPPGSGPIQANMGSIDVLDAGVLNVEGSATLGRARGVVSLGIKGNTSTVSLGADTINLEANSIACLGSSPVTECAGYSTKTGSTAGFTANTTINNCAFKMANVGARNCGSAAGVYWDDDGTTATFHSPLTSTGAFTSNSISNNTGVYSVGNGSTAAMFGGRAADSAGAIAHQFYNAVTMTAGTDRYIAKWYNDSSISVLQASLTTDGTLIAGYGPVTKAASKTAPTISSGFGTSPSIVGSNGTVAFEINVGTGGVANSGVIGLPTATTAWVCICDDLTTPGVNETKQTAVSTTTCTMTNYNTTTGATAAWAASDKLYCHAFAF